MILLERLWASVIWPSTTDWALTCAAATAYAVVAIPYGFSRGFLCWRPRLPTAGQCLGLLFAPGILEEAIFRVGLLPHPSEECPPVRWLGWALVSWTFFVLSHPVNSWLVRREARGTFDNPHFLTLAGLLGGVCTALYACTGALVTVVLVHWLAVCAWLFLGGGWDRLHLEAASRRDEAG